LFVLRLGHANDRLAILLTKGVLKRKQESGQRVYFATEEFKKQLLKAAVKAGRLYRQTRDPELEALIRKVEETL